MLVQMNLSFLVDQINGRVQLDCMTSGRRWNLKYNGWLFIAEK